MAFSLTTVKTAVKGGLAVASKHSHAVAAGFAIISMAGAVYKAVKATEVIKDRLEEAYIKKNEAYFNQHNAEPQSVEIVDGEEIEVKTEVPDPEDLTTKEKAVIIAKTYWPVALLATLSAGLMVGSVILAERQIKAMALLATTAEAALDQYETAAEKVLGPDKAADISNQAAEDAVALNMPNEDLIPHSGHGNNLIYDKLTNSWCYSSVEWIKDVVNDLNAQLAEGAECISLNDYLEESGFGSMELGDQLYWGGDNSYTMEKIRLGVEYIGHPNDPNKAIAVIALKTYPKTRWV
jgi:hypothetical protein